MDYNSEAISVRGRIMIPKTGCPNRQSVYVFGMYRSGSSVLEAVSTVLAHATGLEPFNVGQILDKAGLSIIDPMDYSRNQLVIEEKSLERICWRGGYLYFGFREIPAEFGQRFPYLSAAVILVRDPRDILISQFKAVQRHTTEGESGRNIVRLREKLANVELENYVVSEEAISFAQRICDGYHDMIVRGVKVLHFERFFDSSGRFDPVSVCHEIISSISDYLPTSWSREQISSHIESTIANSRSLKGHATGGKTGMYRYLSPEIQEKLADKLSKQILLLGYS